MDAGETTYMASSSTANGCNTRTVRQSNITSGFEASGGAFYCACNRRNYLGALYNTSDNACGTRRTASSEMLSRTENWLGDDASAMLDTTSSITGSFRTTDWTTEGSDSDTRTVLQCCDKRVTRNLETFNASS
jgi:hypothetical protein